MKLELRLLIDPQDNPARYTADLASLQAFLPVWVEKKLNLKLEINAAVLFFSENTDYGDLDFLYSQLDDISNHWPVIVFDNLPKHIVDGEFTDRARLVFALWNPYKPTASTYPLTHELLHYYLYMVGKPTEIFWDRVHDAESRKLIDRWEGWEWITLGGNYE